MKWIPIAEQLPPNGSPVLVYTRAGEFCVARWSGRKWLDLHQWLENWSTETNWNPVTHWMPIPEAPSHGS